MFVQDLLSVDSCAASPCLHKQRWLAVLLLLVSIWPGFSHADEQGEFQVDDAHAWSEGSVQMLDAQFAVRLSTGAKEALENGVPLVLEFQVQLVKTHKWFWDTVDIELTQRRQVQYHALSRSYLVRDLVAGTQGNYRRLDDALRAAGSIQDLTLTRAPLEAGHRYLIRIRGSLDIESLPTPVRLFAYVSSAWDMQSEWYSWPLAR
ncbi:MAG TPA: DUF4390 domain-containing protein [Gammaproteobacteria bacterium]|nr:DUF4390 domain-containing protein [Gammaproteobacteria bacterium]